MQKIFEANHEGVFHIVNGKRRAMFGPVRCTECQSVIRTAVEEANKRRLICSCGHEEIELINVRM